MILDKDAFSSNRCVHVYIVALVETSQMHLCTPVRTEPRVLDLQWPRTIGPSIMTGPAGEKREPCLFGCENANTFQKKGMRAFPCDIRRGGGYSVALFEGAADLPL